MAKEKIVSIMANKRQKIWNKTRFLGKALNIVDSGACGSASGGPTSLDNRFAVTHTDHSAPPLPLNHLDMTGEAIKN